MSDMVYRLDKGVPLSNEEVDGNFELLYDRTTSLLDTVIYVSQGGDDTRDGKQKFSAVRSIKRGLELLTAMGGPAMLSVYPGDYVEKGDLEVPENCAVVSSGGQYVTNVIAADGFEEKNMFLVNSGCYIQGFAFRNQRVDDLDSPTVGFAVAFAPGARIVRSPYIRDCSQVSNYIANQTPQPLDPENGNPLVGNGGGMLLADRAVLDRYSAFPYMLAFGATPRTPNGLGYVAKNGAGINGIGSLTIFSRVSFFAIDGGQITLNNSGTQFGDISMYAKGSREVVKPKESAEPLTADPGVAQQIRDSTTSLVNDMWTALAAQYPTFASTSENETATRKDAALFLNYIASDIAGGTQQLTQSFSLGLFDYKADKVYDVALEPPFIYSWEWLRDEIKTRFSTTADVSDMLDGLVSLVVRTVTNPDKVIFGSLIESIAHQFNNAGAGVNRLGLPVSFRQPGRNRPVPFSVVQENGGRARWSGSDERNIQYFGDDFRIDGRTGRIYGRAFNRTVRQISRRMANARGSF